MALTFDYSPSNVCAGQSLKDVRQGPAPEKRDRLIAPTPSPQGRYVTRETKRMRWSDWRANWAWLQALPKPAPAESIEEWMRRHGIAKKLTRQERLKRWRASIKG